MTIKRSYLHKLHVKTDGATNHRNNFIRTEKPSATIMCRTNM